MPSPAGPPWLPTRRSSKPPRHGLVFSAGVATLSWIFGVALFLAVIIWAVT